MIRCPFSPPPWRCRHLAAAAPALAQPAPVAAARKLPAAGLLRRPRHLQVGRAAADGRVTFRICAPEAHEVRVTSNDIDEAIPMGIQPGSTRGLAMTRDSTGLWTATTAVPVPADTYRFNFQVDGARVPDPQGTTWSHERVGTNSTFETTGAGRRFPDLEAGRAARRGQPDRLLVEHARPEAHRDGLHPARLHERAERYPVLYLVHGAGDSYDSWTSVGHANLILDNLIAAGKARPMIVVMPFGHTPDRPMRTGRQHPRQHRSSATT
jgi:enterochelin esterase family protein